MADQLLRLEATTAELLRRRPGLARDAERLVRRERRFSVDGAAADPHPFDVTVEAGPIPELWDCKWGARGIDASLLAELEDHLSEEEAREVFDTVINWGRYAELFAYDYDRRVLSLENPS